MNLSWLILSFISTLNWTSGAPAVSSVHVSFVSGNKATQYSHGSGADGTLVQYNLDDKGGDGDHTVSKRSATRVPDVTTTSSYPTTTTRSLRAATGLRIVTIKMPKNTKITTESTTKIYTTTDTDADIQTTTKSSGKRKRIRFIKPASSSTTGSSTMSSGGDKETTGAPTHNPVVMMGTRLDSELYQSTAATTNDGTAAVKPKDTKAVKRSPFLGGNFASSFPFPNFDEFGGNDFGSLRNFVSPSGGGGGGGVGSRASYSQHNPESLSPEGVFMPPLPTEASHYSSNDPYLADPDTAKYAAQHPPFFSEFPHKRTVLALNERRDDNGLEPNLLRSIRPFFPFFELNNHGTYDVHRRADKYFFDDLEPTVLLYAEQVLPPVESWNLYTVL